MSGQKLPLSSLSTPAFLPCCVTYERHPVNYIFLRFHISRSQLLPDVLLHYGFQVIITTSSFNITLFLHSSDTLFHIIGNHYHFLIPQIHQLLPNLLLTFLSQPSSIIILHSSPLHHPSPFSYLHTSHSAFHHNSHPHSFLLSSIIHFSLHQVYTFFFSFCS